LKFLKAGDKGFENYLSRTEQRIGQESLRLEREIRSILNDVRKRGDEALVYYTQVFDGVRVPVEQLQVKRGEVE
jgi:histidinol dehydrogenase